MNKIRNLKFFESVCILAFVLVIISFHFLQAQVKATGKPAPPQPALPHLELGDVITTESAALSVRRYPIDAPIWTKKTESYYYNDVAVGDVDSDGKSEIVVPVSKGNGSPFTIFIDVYKEGSGVPISSEKYSPGYFTDDSRVICDVTIANVIPESGDQINEIVLQHWYNLVIFQWDGTNFRIKKRIEARYRDLPVIAYNGTTTKNFDADPEEEIFVSGQNSYSGPGYIYKIDMDEFANYTHSEIGSTNNYLPIKNFMIGHSLRVADLDGDSALEICLPAWYEDKSTSVSYWTAYLLVLELDSGQPQWSYIIIPEYEPLLVSPYIRLDVGELNSTLPGDGEEIALYINQQASSVNWLYIFKYPFPSNGAPIERRLQDANAISDIKIGNILSGNKIVVCGNAPPLKGNNSRKYFEVFDISMNSNWKVFGESGSIGNLAIVK